MRKLIVGSGMKMYLDLQRTLAWLRVVGASAACGSEVDIFVLPSFPFLYYARFVLQDTPVCYGAQNMHFQEWGAVTGEVSPRMLTDLGCTYVELGHSERRRLFGETDGTVNQKLRLALDVGLVPIVCLGEDLKTKESGHAGGFLRQQLRGVCRGIRSDQVSRTVLAYEPVWAIGVDEPAEADHIAASVHVIRSELGKMYGGETAEGVRIMYGGSVDLRRAEEILNVPGVDGLFIGRASLQPRTFLGFVDVARTVACRAGSADKELLTQDRCSVHLDHESGVQPDVKAGKRSNEEPWRAE